MTAEHEELVGRGLSAVEDADDEWIARLQL